MIIDMLIMIIIIVILDESALSRHENLSSINERDRSARLDSGFHRSFSLEFGLVPIPRPNGNRLMPKYFREKAFADG
jgi:hypothetical protein